MLAFLEKDFH